MAFGIASEKEWDVCVSMEKRKKDALKEHPF